MAAFAEAVSSTPVFAPQQRLRLDTTTTVRSDVFASRERQLTAATGIEPRRIAIRLSIGDSSIELVYLDFGAGLPAWAHPVLHSLSERWGVEPGWDGYNAKSTNLQHVVRLLNHLSALMREDSMAPIMVPLSDGGMQAEWHRNRQDLEVVVPTDEPPRYYYFNEVTAEEEEGDLDPNQAHVQDLIMRFR